MKRILMALVLAAGASVAAPSAAEASIYWGGYWGNSAYLNFVPSGLSAYITAPMGYWYGSYAYNYGGYIYNPYMGSYYNSAFYNPYYTWGSSAYIWGFNGLMNYRWLGSYTYRTYWNSWYWDPQGTGFRMDVVTGGDGLGHYSGLTADFASNFVFGSDSYQVFSGPGTSPYASGSAPGLTYMTMGQLDAYYAAQAGVDATNLNAYMTSAERARLLSDVGVNGLIGVRTISYPFSVPTPGAAALLGIGSVLIIRRRRRGV